MCASIEPSRCCGIDKLSGVSRRVGERGARALLHHVTQLTGEDQRDVAPAFGFDVVLGANAAGQPSHRRLDEHDVPTCRGVIHARRHAGLVGFVGVLGVDLGPPEQFAHLLRVDRELGGPGGGQVARQLAGHGAHLAFQLAHPAFPGVAADQRAQSRVFELRRVDQQTRLFELPRNDVALGDLELLAFRVTGERDDLHAVEQGGWNGVCDVGGGDEQHLAQVEWHVQVMIGELAVLGGVEHLQQSAGRIAVERSAELLDLVQQEHGVLAAGLAQTIQMIRPGIAPT